MKKLISALCACIVLVSAFCVTAAAQPYTDSDSGVSVELPDEYTVLTSSNLSKYADFIESIGHSTESLRKAMNSGNIVMYAAVSDNTKQIHLKCWSSDFSVRTGDLSSLSEEGQNAALESMKKVICGDGNEILLSEKITHDGLTYLKLAVSVPADAPFCYIQYVTVSGGRFISLVYYNAHGWLTADEQRAADSVFSTVSVPKKSGGISSFGIMTVTEIVLIALLILAGVALIIYIIRSFFIDYKNSREEPEIIPDRIKMNRKK